MQITNALRPVQEAARSEQAASDFQIGLQKKVQKLEADVLKTLLSSAGIGGNVDLKA